MPHTVIDLPALAAVTPDEDQRLKPFAARPHYGIAEV